MTLSFTTLEQVEEHYRPDEVKKYPIVFRRRVTPEEAVALDEWLTKRRNNTWVDDLKTKVEKTYVEPKRIKKEPVPKPPSKADIIIDRLHGRYPINKKSSGYELAGSGEPVTVKTCTDIVEYGRTGRFTIDRKPHEKLVERNGYYLFAVIKQNGDDFSTILHLLKPAAHIIDKTNGLRIKVHPVKLWGEKACIKAGLKIGHNQPDTEQLCT